MENRESWLAPSLEKLPNGSLKPGSRLGRLKVTVCRPQLEVGESPILLLESEFGRSGNPGVR